MAQQHNVKSQIPPLLQSTATAYTTLAKGILALDQLNKVPELLEAAIRSLKEEHGKYEDLLKELSRLSVQYKKLDVETKSHIRTVKEQAQMNTKIIKEAKQQVLKGNNIPNYFVEIEATVKEAQTSSEELKEKYDDVLVKVKECCSKAKAGYERNEDKADLAEKGATVGLVRGTGGIFGTLQGTTKALSVFGIPGTQVRGYLGFNADGSLMAGMALSLPFTTAEDHFRKCAEKFQVLDETISQIDQVLWKNFEVLTEICRLLKKLKKTAKSLADAREDTCNIITQDEVEECSGLKPLDVSNHTAGSESVTQNSDTGTPSDDNEDIDFLIALRFDSFKRASEELEKNCDYLLDDKALGLLSFNKKCNKNSTDKEKLN